MADRSGKPKLNVYSYANAFPVDEDQDDEEGRRGRCRTCCCCILAALLLLILAAGVAALVFYLLYRPKLPSYAVQELKLRALNASGSSVTSDIAFSLRADNPNSKIAFRYSSISTALFFQGSLIGSGSVPGFEQPKHNVTIVRSQIKGSKLKVPSSTASRLNAALRGDEKGVLPLSTVTRVKVRVKVGKLLVPRFLVRVNCDLRLSQRGSRLISSSCKVRKFKW